MNRDSILVPSNAQHRITPVESEPRGPESLHRRTFIASLFATLALPQFALTATAQDSVVREIPLRNPVELARIASRSTLCLVMNQERSVSCGSATLIQAPPAIRALLHNDEVLAVSVAHNFSDWNPSNILIAGRFKSISSNGEGKDERRYHARLVNRFTHVVGNPTALVDTSTSYKAIDVSLVAIRIPDTERPEVDELLLTIAPFGSKVSQGQKVVAVGFGPHGSMEHQGSPLVSIPPISWREGAVIGSVEDRIATQYGEYPVQDIRTTVSNVQGDSGGGLFLWNADGNKPMLVGICTAGGKVDKGTTDFDGFIPSMPPIYTISPGESTEGIPEDALIARSESEVTSILHKIREQRMGWVLNSEFRGCFCHSDSVFTLIQHTIGEYDGLLNKRESIVEAHKELALHIERRTLLPGKEKTLSRELDTLYQEALRRVDEQIAVMKPRR
jgi:hypothetical protein